MYFSKFHKSTFQWKIYRFNPQSKIETSLTLFFSIVQSLLKNNFEFVSYILKYFENNKVQNHPVKFTASDSLPSPNVKTLQNSQSFCQDDHSLSSSVLSRILDARGKSIFIDILSIFLKSQMSAGMLLLLSPRSIPSSTSSTPGKTWQRRAGSGAHALQPETLRGGKTTASLPAMFSMLAFPSRTRTLSRTLRFAPS